MNFAEAISQFDWEAFHFIRPMFLWLGVPLMLGLILLGIGNREKSDWKKLISKHLQPYMFSKGNSSVMIYILMVYFLTSAVLLLALAGPTWRMKEVPGATSEAQLVIATDLSWSMMSNDIQPTRIERAKLKIQDLMKANPRVRTGLVAFAGTTHLVLPPTRDYSLITHHANHLQPWIMPVFGTDYARLFTLTDTLFSRISAPSTLLIITDGIKPEEVNMVRRFVDNTPHYVEFMVFNTSEGATIPGFRRGTEMKDDQDKPVNSKSDIATWRQLSQIDKVTVNQLTLDQSDVERIAEKIGDKLLFTEDDKQSQEEWEDMGLLLVIPAAILLMFWFRRGFVIQWCLLVGGVVMACSPTSQYADWWYSDDYRAQAMEQEGDFLMAAETYSKIPRKAIAYYKAGDYDAAASLFEMDSSAQGKYNLGLALTKLGRLDEAIAAFEAAENLDPLMKAKEAAKRAAEMSYFVDSVKRFDPEKARTLDKAEDQGPLNERRAASDDEQLTSDTEVDELPETGNRVTDEIETDMRKAEELERPPENQEFGQQQQAQNVLLKKISADPSEFLRRRFRMQHERYFPEVKNKAEPW